MTALSVLVIEAILFTRPPGYADERSSLGDEPDRPQCGKKGARGVAAVEKRKEERESARRDFRAPQQDRAVIL